MRTCCIDFCLMFSFWFNYLVLCLNFLEDYKSHMMSVITFSVFQTFLVFPCSSFHLCAPFWPVQELTLLYMTNLPSGDRCSLEFPSSGDAVSVREALVEWVYYVLGFFQFLLCTLTFASPSNYNSLLELRLWLQS